MRRRKRSFLLISSVGVLFLAVAIASSWSFLLERWYLHQLTWDGPDAQDRACLALADMGCERAIPTFVHLLEERPGSFVYLSAPGRALVSLGAPSVEPVLDRLEDHLKRKIRGPAVPAFRRVLREIGPAAATVLTKALTPDRPALVREVLRHLQALDLHARPALLSLILYGPANGDFSETVSRILLAFPEDAHRLIQLDLADHPDSVDAIEMAFERMLRRSDLSSDHLEFLHSWAIKRPWAVETVVGIAVKILRGQSLQRIAPHQADGWRRRVFELGRGDFKLEGLLIKTAIASKDLAELAFPFVETRLRSDEPLRVRHGLLQLKAFLDKTGPESLLPLFDSRVLLQLTKHDDDEIRLRAGGVLMRLPESPERTAALSKLLADRASEVRLKVALAVFENEVVPCGDLAEEQLFRALHAGDAVVKIRVLRAMQSRRIRDEPRLLKALERLQAERLPEIRMLVVSLLSKRLEPEAMLASLIRDVDENRTFWKSFERLFWFVDGIDCCPRERASFLIDQAEFFSSDYLTAFSNHYRNTDLRPAVVQVLTERIRESDKDWKVEGQHLIDLAFTLKVRDEGFLKFWCERLIARDARWLSTGWQLFRLLEQTGVQLAESLDVVATLMKHDEHRKDACAYLTLLPESQRARLFRFLLPSEGFEREVRDQLAEALAEAPAIRSAEPTDLAGGYLLQCLEGSVEDAVRAGSLALAKLPLLSVIRVRCLLRVLRHRDPAVRRVLDGVKVRIDGSSEGLFLAALRASSVEVQRSLLAGLLHARGCSEELVTALEELVASPDRRLSVLAWLALEHLGRGKVLLPLPSIEYSIRFSRDEFLLSLPEDSVERLFGDRNQGYAWVRALPSHPLSDPKVEALWISLIENEEHRGRALAQLSKFPEAPPALVKNVVRVLDDVDLHEFALDCFYVWGPKAKAALPELRERLGSRVPHIRSTAIRAVLRVSPSEPLLGAIVRKRLRAGGTSRAEMLASLDENCAALLPLVLENVDLWDPGVLPFIKRLGTAGRPAFDRLARERRRSLSENEGRQLLDTLMVIGREDRRLVSVLIDSLYGSAEKEAISALGRMGALAKDALPHLKRGIEGWALGRIQANSAGSVPERAAWAIQEIRKQIDEEDR
ncbi:MAG: hypothetical protein AAF517_00610 [Planctomycetota bacterium]